jgi:hypothetical protein
MGVQVHQAGQQHLADGVDHLGTAGRFQRGSDLGDLPVTDQDVDRVALAVETHSTNQNR